MFICQVAISCQYQKNVPAINIAEHSKHYEIYNQNNNSYYYPNFSDSDVVRSPPLNQISDLSNSISCFQLPENINDE